MFQLLVDPFRVLLVLLALLADQLQIAVALVSAVAVFGIVGRSYGHGSVVEEVLIGKEVAFSAPHHPGYLLSLPHHQQALLCLYPSLFLFYLKNL